MQYVTSENIAQFKPTYPPYEDRLAAHVASIGVTGQPTPESYRTALLAWNDQSKIGFSEEEINILSLIYPEEEANQRFVGSEFLHPTHGGNTAEHPIFMGHLFDKFKDDAGYMPENFDPDSSDHLALAKISQQVHALIALHDIGELIDISYSEQVAVGASFKEPEEEKLIAPFKIHLAAAALAQKNPALYTDTISAMRKEVLQAKDSLLNHAKAGEISGDDFVRGVGKAIAGQIEKNENLLVATDEVSPNLKEAVNALNNFAERSQAITDFESVMMNLTDKTEGSSHYIALMGEHGKKQASTEEDATHKLHTRLFNKGESLSYLLASSKQVLSDMSYTLKAIPKAFGVLQNEKENHTLKTRLVRAGTASIFRNYAQMLQKAPPLLDYDSTKKALTASLTKDTNQQTNILQDRLETRDVLKTAWKAKAGKSKYPLTELSGVTDTKSVIALCEKAARQMESGEWIPTQAELDVFSKGGNLPEKLQIANLQELNNLCKAYPLEAAETSLRAL